MLRFNYQPHNVEVCGAPRAQCVNVHSRWLAARPARLMGWTPPGLVLTLLYLPPYSPQLNTIERLWKLARRLATHNRYFATLEALIQAVSTQFRRWRRPNAVLRRLCCII